MNWQSGKNRIPNLLSLDGRGEGEGEEVKNFFKLFIPLPLIPSRQEAVKKLDLSRHPGENRGPVSS